MNLHVSEAELPAEDRAMARAEWVARQARRPVSPWPILFEMACTGLFFGAIVFALHLIGSAH